MLLYQEDAELLFPARLIPTLRELRGEEFRCLVDRVLACPSEADEELLAFALMMIRMASCITCTADSYRAMNGCTRCAQKVIRSFKGKDGELVKKWENARAEILRWQAAGETPCDEAELPLEMAQLEH